MISSHRTGRMPALLGATALATSLLVGSAAFAEEPKHGGTHDSTPYIMAPYVKGYVHAPQNWQDFRTVWLDRE